MKIRSLVWGGYLTLLGTVSGVFALGLDDLPYPDDPLSSHSTLSRTPGRASMGVGSDPCRLDRRKPEVWSLIDVIEWSLCHNPRTHEVWANAKIQASQLGVAESEYLPNLNLTLPLSRSQNTAGGSFNNLVPIGGSGDNRTDNTRFAPVLSLNYLLLDFGGRAARVELARQALEVANWTQASELQSVLFEAIQAYYQYFASRAALEAAEATEKNAAVALDSATYRHQVGAVALSDKLQAQTAHAQARVSRRTAAGNAEVALGTLANVMGLKPNHTMQFEKPGLTGPISERERDVQTLIEMAKNSRPDLAAAEAQIRASEAGVLSAQSNSLPQLNLVGDYTYYETFGVSSLSSWLVGVQVTVPLFTGFRDTYQIKQAREQVEQETARRDQLERSVALDVWRAYYTLAANRENLENTQDLLDSATQSESVALGRYQEGIGNIVELLNNVSNLANARYQHVQAHYNWRIGKAQLAQALGRLDVDDVAAVQGPRSIGDAR